MLSSPQKALDALEFGLEMRHAWQKQLASIRSTIEELKLTAERTEKLALQHDIR